MSPLAQNPPSKLDHFFYCKLHDVSSHCRVWTAL